MIRVFVADDHAIVRDGIQRLLSLESDFEVAGVATDGLDALDALEGARADVALLDLSLPRLGGVQLVKAVREQFPHVGVVVLSMYPEDQLALHLFSLGVLAYLSKSRSSNEIMEALRAASRGERYVTDTLARLSGNDRSAGRLPHQTLSPREYQVFLLLVSGKTVSEVGYEMDLSTSTVSNHIAKIREKIGAQSVNDILRYAARVGLI